MLLQRRDAELSDRDKVVGLFVYPGDELLGTSLVLDEIDTFIYMFGKSNDGHKIMVDKNTIIAISGTAKIPTWRCGIYIREILESLRDEIKTVYSPSVFEPEMMRKELGETVHIFYANFRYDFQLIDYSIEGIQPKAKRFKLTQDQDALRRAIASTKYGTRRPFNFKNHEEYNERLEVKE